MTAAAGEDLVDIQDRNPLVFTPELARKWIDLGTTTERVAEIVQTGCRPSTDFRWFPVRKEVGNVRNQGAELIQPVQPQ